MFYCSLLLSRGKWVSVVYLSRDRSPRQLPQQETRSMSLIQIDFFLSSVSMSSIRSFFWQLSSWVGGSTGGRREREPVNTSGSSTDEMSLCNSSPLSFPNGSNHQHHHLLLRMNWLPYPPFHLFSQCPLLLMRQSNLIII